MSETISDQILRIEYDLSGKLRNVDFGLPVKYVYNPLVYARDCHENFVRRYCGMSNGEILFLGMNPGPWGMCQNGIPFGERSTVNGWFQARGRIEHPEQEHPRVRVEGFDCNRSEDSGKRFWGLMRELCETPENFFKNCLVYNYCPLAFLKESGANITPNEIKGDKRGLYGFCNEALAEIITGIDTKIVIAIGRFPQDRVKEVLKQKEINAVQVYYMPHPSRRAGLSDEEWKRRAEEVLRESGVYERLTQHRRNEQ